MTKADPLEPGFTIVGIGTTGKRVVRKMSRRLQAHCIGVGFCTLPGGSSEQLVTIDIFRNDVRQDGTASIGAAIVGVTVLVVASLDEDTGNALEEFLDMVHHTARVYLLTPEPAVKTDRRGILVLKRDGKYHEYEAAFPRTALKVVDSLNGMIVLAADSLPVPGPFRCRPHLAAWDNLLLKAASRFIDDAAYELPSVVGLADLNSASRSVIRYGTGMAAGNKGGIRAVESAIACLSRQGVKLPDVDGIALDIAGASGMTATESEEIRIFANSVVTPDTNVVVRELHEDSPRGGVMVTIMTWESFSRSRNIRRFNEINTGGPR